MFRHIMKTIILLLAYFPFFTFSYAQTTLPGGLPMPSLEDERNTYRSWGWTWTVGKEPNYLTDTVYSVANPDMHGDTEGDDLWSYTMMYRRTSQGGYRRRMEQWARYFKDDYFQCIPSGGPTYCYDRDNWISDHTYGWGLIAYYELTGDASYRAAAENIAGDLERRYANATPGNRAMGYWGLRSGSRHLLLATRVAEANPIQRWTALRDKLINLWLQSTDWDSRGMYFHGPEGTNEQMGAGSYAAGARVVSSFQIGILAEALYQAYRTTGKIDLKNRLVAIANFVYQYGLDQTYQYTGSWFGIKNNAAWHNYSSGGTATFWDPVYTTSLVNTLVIGYKLTGERRFYDQAKLFFNRGTKGVYGSPTQRAAADNQVHHFVDTRFGDGFSPDPIGNPYLAYNKGELQYTYMIFENGGAPSTDATPPAAPKNLTVK